MTCGPMTDFLPCLEGPVGGSEGSHLCATQGSDTSFPKTAITIMNRDAENARIEIMPVMKPLFQINPNKIS